LAAATSAGDQLYLYYHSKNRPAPNRMMWADAETDRLLAAGRHTSNDADREKHFREVQLRMHDEALMLPAVHSRLFLAAKKSIKDLRSHGIYSAALYKGLDVRPCPSRRASGGCRSWFPPDRGYAHSPDGRRTIPARNTG
jgi:hypothetical protein